MDRLIYTAMSGMAAAMTRQRVIANNLANAQTIGFRAEVMRAAPVTVKGAGIEARALAAGAVTGATMTPGAVIATGNPLDLALAGADTLLAVQADDGAEAYTRRGDLAPGADGVLRTGDGHAVLGETGPVSVPPDSRVSIGPDGSVSVAGPAPDAPSQVIDRLRLVSASGSAIAKTLDGLFRVTGAPGGALPADPTARVQPGALEQSNVDATGALVQMIEAQRLFDMRTRALTTAKDIDESGAALMRVSAA